ncbi:hypothetical protein SHKM778_12920 [Streptomyces sp. KM77-8]|uniref:Uncharacterized protein n=1 Tax=Streptomyces haneummycinicus TaxID=3074435 RepID=A0AAT9HBZ4_9ACTN
MVLDALARLTEERVDHRFKGLPPDAGGLTVGELAAQRRNLFTGGFTTPCSRSPPSAWSTTCG